VITPRPGGPVGPQLRYDRSPSRLRSQWQCRL